MKRFALLLSLLLCVLALPGAYTAQGEPNLLAACLGQRYPDFTEAAYAEWGNTAAAVFVHNGQPPIPATGRRAAFGLPRRSRSFPGPGKNISWKMFFIRMAGSSICGDWRTKKAI